MSLLSLPKEESKSRDREMEQEIERHRRETQNEREIETDRNRSNQGHSFNSYKKKWIYYSFRSMVNQEGISVLFNCKLQTSLPKGV